MKQNKLSWENIYNNGESYLEYPNEALIVSYHRIKRYLPKHCTCLDYGFGSGNNSDFLIKRVDDFYGIEISNQAKELTSQRLQEYKNFKKDNLFLSNNEFIPELENKFDLIVAWHVISYNDEESIKVAIENLYTYLKPNGILITSLATPNDVSKKHSSHVKDNNYIINEKIEDQTGCSVIIPKDEIDFEKYFPQFKTLDIGKEERVSFKIDDLHSHYYGIFQK